MIKYFCVELLIYIIKRDFILTQENDNKILALEYLKEKIITCEMPPGSIIKIEEIAEILKVSKTPVREALIELQYDGYVTIIPRKKTVVSKISLQDLRNIYDARTLIETYIIQSLTPEEVENNRDELLNLLKKWQEINISGNSKNEYAEFLKEDLNFHKSIIKFSSNPHLTRYCKELIYKSQRFWYMALFNNDLRKMREEHIKILEFILQNKTKEAASCLKSHISISKALSILSD